MTAAAVRTQPRHRISGKRFIEPSFGVGGRAVSGAAQRPEIHRREGKE